MNSIQELYSATVESADFTNTEVEREFTFYAKLKSLDDLQMASKVEEHEQYEIPFDSDKPIRARVRKVDNDLCYFTTKKKVDDISNVESTVEVTKEMFKTLSEVALCGYKKRRHIIPVMNSANELTWEIDVFYTSSTVLDDWVKIDLEIDDPSLKIPDFPIQVETLIWADNPKLNPRDKAFIDSLWEERWQKVGSVNVITNIKRDIGDYILNVQVADLDDEFD